MNPEQQVTLPLKLWTSLGFRIQGLRFWVILPQQWRIRWKRTWTIKRKLGSNSGLEGLAFPSSSFDAVSGLGCKVLV